jgi:hypothetical protein
MMEVVNSANGMAIALTAAQPVEDSSLLQRVHRDIAIMREIATWTLLNLKSNV